MKDEYIIVNKTQIQKRIEELNEIIEFRHRCFFDCSEYESEVRLINRILSQSTPLIPEIEKAFDASKITTGMNQRNQFAYKYKTSQDYISNLKLDI